MKNYLLYFHTIRHLKFKQMYYQLWYRLKGNYFNFNYTYKEDVKFNFDLKNWNLPSTNKSLEYNGDLTFTFLNKSKTFHEIIDWNFLEYGKLWHYHLQYMDYLLDEKIPLDVRTTILLEQSEQIIERKLKLESYPISLRWVNALIFIRKHSIQQEKINKALGIQLSFLENNLEYHLLANHLLENYTSLCFAYVALDVKVKQTKYLKLFFKELDEQILKDGAHYERTPAYHAQILIHLFQLVYLLEITNQQIEALAALKKICSKMLGWYKVISLDGKHISLFCDSAGSNTLAYYQLQELADYCNIKPDEIELKECGYRILRNENVTIIVNCGNINPSFQVGHAHSDILHFVLYFKGIAILVDTGISTYENTQQRLLEKSTRMHNTVSVGEEDQSQIWSSFRIAKRATILIQEESSIKISAEVKWQNGVIHKRAFTLLNNTLVIEDAISNIPTQKDLPKATFHFDHLLNNKVLLNENEVQIGELQMHFSNYQKITSENYLQAEDFNKQSQAVKISAYFTGDLKTVFSWKQ